MLIVVYLGRSAVGLVLMTSYLAVQCDVCCSSRVASAVTEYRDMPFEGGYRGGGCDAVSSCSTVRQLFGQLVASMLLAVRR